MMGKLALAVASAVLLSSATALAATSAATKDQMQHSAMKAKAMATTAMANKVATVKKTADTSMAHKAMAAKAMSAKTMTHTGWHKGWHKTAMHKAAWHHKAASTGEREVHALNLLEAAGYRSITGVHPKGMNVMATAVKAGKTQNLTITSAGKIIPTT
ncbi:MAG: hypothetical protein ACP5QR_10425 [Rhizomicrobium sp.]